MSNSSGSAPGRRFSKAAQNSSWKRYSSSPAPSSSGEWGEDAYPAQTTTRYALYTTARHFGRLAKRVLMGAA